MGGEKAGRYVAAPLLFLNTLMYIVVLGFASSCIDRLMSAQSHGNPGMMVGNQVTVFFVIFSLLAGVVGVASKAAGSSHIKAWRHESLGAAASTAIVAWSITALAFGFACKEIHVGGYRGWRLKVLEAFVIILTFTQFLYLLALHAGLVAERYGPDRAPPSSGTPIATPRV